MSATRRLATREYVTVKAISLNMTFVRPSTNTIGANTQIVVRVEAVMAAETPAAPLMAASFLEQPWLLSLYMFSITTMELSTSIPMPTERPARDMMLSCIPEKYIKTMAKVMLIGMLTAVIRVGFISRRNMNSTIMARIPPVTRLFKTDEMAMSM